MKIVANLLYMYRWAAVMFWSVFFSLFVCLSVSIIIILKAIGGLLRKISAIGRLWLSEHSWLTFGRDAEHIMDILPHSQSAPVANWCEMWKRKLGKPVKARCQCTPIATLWRFQCRITKVYTLLIAVLLTLFGGIDNARLHAVVCCCGCACCT